MDRIAAENLELSLPHLHRLQHTFVTNLISVAC